MGHTCSKCGDEYQTSAHGNISFDDQPPTWRCPNPSCTGLKADYRSKEQQPIPIDRYPEHPKKVPGETKSAGASNQEFGACSYCGHQATRAGVVEHEAVCPQRPIETPVSVVVGPIEVRDISKAGELLTALRAVRDGALSEGRVSEYDVCVTNIDADGGVCNDRSNLLHNATNGQSKRVPKQAGPYYLREIYPSKAAQDAHGKDSEALKAFRTTKGVLADFKDPDRAVDIPRAAVTEGEVVSEVAFLASVNKSWKIEDLLDDSVSGFDQLNSEKSPAELASLYGTSTSLPRATSPTSQTSPTSPTSPRRWKDRINQSSRPAANPPKNWWDNPDTPPSVVNTDVGSSGNDHGNSSTESFKQSEQRLNVLANARFERVASREQRDDPRVAICLSPNTNSDMEAAAAEADFTHQARVAAAIEEASRVRGREVLAARSGKIYEVMRTQDAGELYPEEGLVGEGGCAKVKKGWEYRSGVDRFFRPPEEELLAIKVTRWDKDDSDENDAELAAGIAVVGRSSSYEPIMAFPDRETVDAEILMFSKLTAHRNICSLIDHEINDEKGVIFLVMPLASGTAVDEHVKSKLKVAEIKSIIFQLLHGLQYAHEQGVAHLDIKWANLLFMDEANTHLVITDLGASKILRPDEQTGTSYGAISFQVPEVMSSGKGDGRADVFVAGCLLWQLLEGPAACYAMKQPGQLICQDAQWLSDAHYPEGPELVELLEGLCDPSPHTRLTATDALLSPWFTDVPISPPTSPPISRGCSRQQQNATVLPFYQALDTEQVMRHFHLLAAENTKFVGVKLTQQADLKFAFEAVVNAPDIGNNVTLQIAIRSMESGKAVAFNQSFTRNTKQTKAVIIYSRVSPEGGTQAQEAFIRAVEFIQSMFDTFVQAL